MLLLMPRSSPGRPAARASVAGQTTARPRNIHLHSMDSSGLFLSDVQCLLEGMLAGVAASQGCAAHTRRGAR